MTKEEIQRRQGRTVIRATHREMLLFLGCREADPPKVVYHMTDSENAEKIIREKRIRCFNSYGCYFLPKKEYMSLYLRAFVETHHRRTTTDHEEIELGQPEEVVLLEIHIDEPQEPHRWYHQKFSVPYGSTKIPDFAEKWARMQYVHRGDLRITSAKLIPTKPMVDYPLICWNIFFCDAGFLPESERIADHIEEYVERMAKRSAKDKREEEWKLEATRTCPAIMPKPGGAYKLDPLKMLSGGSKEND